ncbi:bZIP basic region leucine zipper domain containing protein [Nitzschia inconspicua]|uniref:BZIP basic region leucine zipper domain containing protein n=1 Tax=Nitzschia inconspicua TaxID=303405 RepID=A0A9K3KGW2_9STRA|nr:bZIP basic region leucine zipper domain containing protein [Nitzschia inconspicua]
MATVSDDPLAAAVAAAAELAKNGGAFLLNAPAVQNQVSSNVPTIAREVIGSSHAAPTVLHPSIAALLSAASGLPTSASPSVSSNHDDKFAFDDDENQDDEDEEDSSSSQSGEDSERRIARSRERNREHARKTRLRKKVQLQALQSKVKGLQAESKILKQSLEECSIASILVGLSSGERDATIQALLKEANSIENKDIFQVVAGKRKRFLSDASLSSERLTPAQQVLDINVGGRTVRVGGGRSQINWKSGLYVNEDGIQLQLTHDQLECLRRERNRMHAKMTRDRKKNFIAYIQQTIQELELSNRKMKAVLADVVHTHFKASSPPSASTTPIGVTPSASPAIGPKTTAAVKVPPLAPSLPSPPTRSRADGPAMTVELLSVSPPPVLKNVCHGFSLKI